MPPPVAASAWQAMNSGVAAFEHCRYLQDTPFPFPWAQLIIAALLVWQVVVPLQVVCSYQSEPIGILLSVVTVWLLWALNEGALHCPRCALPLPFPLRPAPPR